MARARKTRVLVVDDHTIVRQGLVALLEGEADIKVVGEAADGREALRQAAALRPEVVVMDVSMPRMNGLEATSRIIKGIPGVRVIALTMHNSEEYVYSLLMAGASGYLPKEAAASDLVLAIRAVRQGGTYLHPAVSMKLVGEYLKRPARRSRSDEVDVLSGREREILQLIAEGSTNKQIAALLGLSVKTIENHRTRIMEKLEIHNVAGLTRYAIGHGITTAATRPARPRDAS